MGNILDVIKLEFEHTDGYPEIKKAVRRYRAKMAKKRREQAERKRQRQGRP